MRRVPCLLLLATACEGAEPRDVGGSLGAPTTSTSQDGTDANGASDDTQTSDEATTSDDDTHGGGPPTLSRVGSSFEIATLPASMPKRFADAAHDPVNDVYLVVNGNGATSGAFLDADGLPVGEPFAVAQTDAWTQGVHLGFGDDAFIVAWHDTRDDPRAGRLRARRVRWDAAATMLGSDTEISTGSTYAEAPPAIAWSANAEVFLLAWHAIPGDDIHARRVTRDGSTIGSEIVVTSDPDWQSDPALAHNPEDDEWLVAYTHAGATVEVRIRRIAADATLLGDPVSLTTASGTWLTQVAFLPDRGEYVVAWFEGEIRARRVARDGTPLADAFVIAPGYGNYDGFAMAHSPTTKTFAAVFHGPSSNEDFAVAFDDSGAQSVVVEATASDGRLGHFNPRVAAHSTRAEWLLVTSRGFATVVGQRLGP
jgi:hypothetical protein